MHTRTPGIAGSCPERAGCWEVQTGHPPSSTGTSHLSNPAAPAHCLGLRGEQEAGSRGSRGEGFTPEAFQGSKRGEGVETRSWDMAAPRVSPILCPPSPTPSPTPHLPAPKSEEAQAACPEVALTLLFPLQTDCALWTVQLQRQRKQGQEVGWAVPTEPTASEGNAALRLHGQR